MPVAKRHIQAGISANPNRSISAQTALDPGREWFIILYNVPGEIAAA